MVMPSQKQTTTFAFLSILKFLMTSSKSSSAALLNTESSFAMHTFALSANSLNACMPDWP